MMHMRGGAQLLSNRFSKARDEALAARLWAVSEKLTGTSFPTP